MLKRQRPSTPPPIPAETSESFSPMMEDVFSRHTKRRRTAAPTLDGQFRRWPPHTSETMDANDEDDFYEDDEGIVDGTDGELYESRSVAGEYRSSNSLLHDLHAEHQHRLTFSSLSSSFSTCASIRDQTPSHHNYLPSMGPTKTLYPSLQEPSIQDYHDSEKDVRAVTNDLHDPSLPFDESQVVRDRYEGTNKLLGSLFLNRRRELDGHHDTSHHNTP